MSYCAYGYGVLAEIIQRVTEQPADHFVQERLFDPLRMGYASYVGVPQERLNRVVRRSPDAPGAFLNRPDLAHVLVRGGGSAYSSALDLAAFGQMFLNRGAYGSVRVLSPAAIREMTRNQIPGVASHWKGEFFPEATWGFGWSVQGNKKSIRDGTLFSPSTLNHGGRGGTYLWVDPEQEIVGVYLSVTPSEDGDPRFRGQVDLFANAITAAVLDEPANR
jgi:CubicO group peptidase (beta-lactamase class C family)